MGYIKIGGAALNQTPMDWDNNIQNIKDAISKAKKQNINILCLPELAITGYGCEDMFLSNWVPDKALELLQDLLSYCQNIHIAIGLPMVFEGKLYNCCAFISNGIIEGFYAKQFLAKDGVHYEPRWFTAWETGKTDTIKINGLNYPIGELVFEVENVKIGFEICEDAWVADDIRPACRLVKKNINIILNPSASHFAFAKSEFRYNLISNSSKIFSCTYVYANLLGNEAGRIIYDGEVLIYKDGEMLQRNNRFSYQNVNLISAEVDFQENKSKQSPLTHDERTREYEFWEATSLGLFDYMRKSKSAGFVLSLSGGADSSACAIMVSEMVKKGVKELGIQGFIQKAGIKITDAEKIKDYLAITSILLTTAYQSTKNSGQETLQSAEALAKSLGATFYHWSVDEEINAYTSTIEKVLERQLTWQQDDIALQNIQARSRAPIIWMLANINNALLITTSNRSEGDVGYATMDGDTAGSIAPIAGVDKHFIRNWLIWAEKNLQQPGLNYVNALTPTAELRPEIHAQTDEKDLMPYDILVQIEIQAIRDRKSPVQTYNLLKEKNITTPDALKSYIIKFYRMWSRNQWKRERIAPSFHLDEFNVDPRSWCRFPILSGSFVQEIKDLENLSS